MQSAVTAATGGVRTSAYGPADLDLGIVMNLATLSFNARLNQKAVGKFIRLSCAKNSADVGLKTHWGWNRCRVLFALVAI